MKKIIIAALVFVPATFLTTSCAVRTAAYVPSSNYVYSVGNYGYRPYWGTGLYTGGWGNVGYWRGYRGVSTGGVFFGGSGLGGWRI